MDKLPAEILHIVLHYLREEQRSLAALNRTCKRLHQLTIPYLYHEPRFVSLSQFQSFVDHVSAHNAEIVRIIDLCLVPYRWHPQTSIGPYMVRLTEKAKDIEELGLEYCALDAESLITSISRLTRLRGLCISRNIAVNSRVVQTITVNLKHLRKLDLSFTNIDDTALYALPENCPDLASLILEECQKITEEGVYYAFRNLGRLRYLNIRNCYNVVSDDDFGTLESDAEWESVGEEED